MVENPWAGASACMKKPEESINDLKAQLAGFVGLYIRLSRAEGPSGDRQQALRLVCAGLEHLLDASLRGSAGWRGWVDGILPATDMLPAAIEVISEAELTVRACAIWGEKTDGPFWIEPFFGSVRLSETGDGIDSYELKFADATRGLAVVPYSKHLRHPEWFLPTQWLFEFPSAREPRFLRLAGAVVGPDDLSSRGGFSGVNPAPAEP